MNFHTTIQTTLEPIEIKKLRSECVRKIIAQPTHSCVITEDGKYDVVNVNFRGQCVGGLKKETFIYEPKNVDVALGLFTKFVVQVTI